ncbi:MAG: AEC family transporter, partial [Actinobacteria bacterium]|nr:AEC family transporter [Actinomycetota bacterium]
LSDEELLAVLDEDPLTVLSGELDHKPELPILLELLAEAEEGGWRALPSFTRPVAVALVLRMGVAPGLLVLASVALVRLPDAYLLQAAMPSGINGLVVAHAYGLDVRVTAGAIAWSTVAAVAGGLVATVAL